MADPELSLQSILIISTILGRLKTWTYVGWVAVFSTLAGLIYGAWVDGTSIGMIVLYLILAIGVLALGLYWVDRSIRSRVAVPSIEIKE
jgi:Zn-dependent protease with chaperone function